MYDELNECRLIFEFSNFNEQDKMNNFILWKMDGFNCKKFLCNVLDVYVSWTTDGCNECAGKI